MQSVLQYGFKVLVPGSCGTQIGMNPSFDAPGVLSVVTESLAASCFATHVG